MVQELTMAVHLFKEELGREFYLALDGAAKLDDFIWRLDMEKIGAPRACCERHEVARRSMMPHQNTDGVLRNTEQDADLIAEIDAEGEQYVD